MDRSNDRVHRHAEAAGHARHGIESVIAIDADGDDHVSVMAGVGVGYGVGLGLAVAIALEASPHPTNASASITMMPTLVVRCIGDTPLRPVLETHGRFRNLK